MGQKKPSRPPSTSAYMCYSLIEERPGRRAASPHTECLRAKLRGVRHETCSPQILISCWRCHALHRLVRRLGANLSHESIVGAGHPMHFRLTGLPVAALCLGLTMPAVADEVVRKAPAKPAD